MLTAIQILLKSYFSKVVALSSPVTLTSVLREEMPEVVLLDMNFTSGINTGNEGLFWLHEIKKVRPDLPVVLLRLMPILNWLSGVLKREQRTLSSNPGTTRNWWKHCKPQQPLRTTTGKRQVKKKPVHSPMYWGESKVMQQLRALIEKVAVTDANLLITGENGTGKEMLAREIHALSNRKYKEMIAVDMGTITESLFESELFGHVKGSFTDAHTDRTGKFEAAEKEYAVSRRNRKLALPSASKATNRHPTAKHCESGK